MRTFSEIMIRWTQSCPRTGGTLRALDHVTELPTEAEAVIRSRTTKRGCCWSVGVGLQSIEPPAHQTLDAK